MADTTVLKKSVTRDDKMQGSSVLHWIVNYAPMGKTGLPAYWSPARDAFLRQVMYLEFHDFWAGAIGIAVTKMSSMAWELESSQPRVRNLFQELLLAADGNQSWTSFIGRHLQDFLGQDNGAFVEIVRATQGAGARIIGLMHLDAARCQRTGDPGYPVIYRDVMGRLHEMPDYSVIALSDMPSPTETYHGVGLSATSRAWGAIRKMEAIERYIYEKVSGDRALALDLLGGVLEKDIRDAVNAAKEDNEARGNSQYLGSIMIPVPSDVPLSHVRINFAELPDGFDYEKQINNCVLVFANAIGLDVQDLQPLTGRPLGTATQSQVLQDKAGGKGLAAWRQQFTHQVNEWILPDSVVYAFNEKDLRDQQRQADLANTWAGVAKTLVDGAIIDGNQAKQILADEDVIPQEFVPQDVTPVEAIGDSEKPEVESDAQDNTSGEQAMPEQPVDLTAKEFDESKHPRDDKGRFGEGGGGGTSASGGPSASGGGGSSRVRNSDETSDRRYFNSQIKKAHTTVASAQSQLNAAKHDLAKSEVASIESKLQSVRSRIAEIDRKKAEVDQRIALLRSQLKPKTKEYTVKSIDSDLKDAIDTSLKYTADLNALIDEIESISKHIISISKVKESVDGTRLERFYAALAEFKAAQSEPKPDDQPQ